MAITNLDKLKDTFFEESEERLEELETELSRIIAEGPDAEGLNAIFRTAHSIKAGAAAFKFTDLVDFAHEFEAVLDLLRNEELEATSDILSLMMEAGDILADLVDAARSGQTVEEASVNDVKNRLCALMGQENPGNTEEEEDGFGLFIKEEETFSETLYNISFKPKAELFLHANDPIFIIKELHALGDLTVQVSTENLPDLLDLDPESSYLNWEFQLKTEKKRDLVEEVFEFVVDDCDLVITEANNGNTVSENTDSTNNAAEEKQKATKLKASNTPTQAAGAGTTQHKTKSIRVDLQRIDKLVNMVGEIVISQSMLSQMVRNTTDDANMDLIRGIEDLALHTRELQESVMAVRMQPVGSLFARMPRVVRDLSRRLNKDIQLILKGEETEIDKTVIEEIGDPINHLLRNAIDHGIENPDEREKAGKPRQGTIELIAEHRGGTIVISIKDNGGGINRDKVLNLAIERGVVEPNANLTPFEIENLIFSPGFSTAAEVTDISGRGVGLDVVKRNIENLGGRVSVSSRPGVGTTFTLILPLTLAVLDGMIVNVGKEKYVIPLTTILESFRPTDDEVNTLPDKRQVVSIRGEYFSLVYLGRVFDVPGSKNDPQKGLVILVETDELGKIGLVVDDIEGQQQVVIKSLEENYDPVPGISAATILGDGKVALILDIDNLKEKAVHRDDVQKLLNSQKQEDNPLSRDAITDNTAGNSETQLEEAR